MEKLGQIVDWTLSQYGLLGILLTVAAVALLAVQLYYHSVRYGLPARGKTLKKLAGNIRTRESATGISVIVLLGDDYWYLDHTLPKILAQEYEELELVVVEIGTTEEFSDQLLVLRDQFPKLTVTRVDNDPRFPISNKIAYNIGIKAARYDNIILTTSDAYPVSPKWIGQMAKGFTRGEIIISYCGLEKKEESHSNMARSSRLFSSVRYLSQALRGKPYRGIIQNLGFTREIYFTNKGFDYLNMNMGEDDLFVQRLVMHGTAAVVANPHATVRQKQWGGPSWWWERRKFFDTATRYYPWSIKLHVIAETLTRLLFFAVVIAMIVLLPLELKITAVLLFLLRMFIVRYYLWRVRKVLGEQGLGNSSMLYDLWYPFSRIWMTIMGRIKPAPGVWR